MGDMTTKITSIITVDEAMAIHERYTNWKSMAEEVDDEPLNTTGQDVSYMFDGFGSALILTKLIKVNGEVIIMETTLPNALPNDLQDVEEPTSSGPMVRPNKKRMAANFEQEKIGVDSLVGPFKQMALKRKLNDDINLAKRKPNDEDEPIAGCSTGPEMVVHSGKVDIELPDQRLVAAKPRRETVAEDNHIGLILPNFKSCMPESNHGRDSERTGSTRNGKHDRYCLNGSCIGGRSCKMFAGDIHSQQFPVEPVIEGLMDSKKWVRVEGRGKDAITEDFKLASEIVEQVRDANRNEFSSGIADKILATHDLYYRSSRTKLVQFDLVIRLAPRFKSQFIRKFLVMVGKALVKSSFANPFVQTRELRSSFLKTIQDVLGNCRVRAMALVIVRRSGERIKIFEQIQIPNREDFLTTAITKQKTMGYYFKLATSTNYMVRALAKLWYNRLDDELKNAILHKRYDYEFWELNNEWLQWTKVKCPVRMESEAMDYWARELSWPIVNLRLWFEAIYMIGPENEKCPVNITLLLELDTGILNCFNSLDIDEEFELMFFKKEERRRADWPTFRNGQPEVKPNVSRQVAYYKQQVGHFIRYVRENREYLLSHNDDDEWVKPMARKLDRVADGELFGTGLSKMWTWVKGQFKFQHDYLGQLPQ